MSDPEFSSNNDFGGTTDAVLAGISIGLVSIAEILNLPAAEKHGILSIAAISGAAFIIRMARADESDKITTSNKPS